MNLVTLAERRVDAHVQHYKRYIQALIFKDGVCFVVAGIKALVPSKRPTEKAHYVIFSGPKLDCDCESFMFGNVHDKNFACYHIMAAQIRWMELTE